MRSRDFEKVAALFLDHEYYTRHYLAGETISPISHFTSIGMKQHCNPSGRFITHDYIARVGDKSALKNPLMHFVRNEMRRLKSDSLLETAAELAAESTIFAARCLDVSDQFLQQVLSKNLFNAAFYLETYSDVAVNGVDPFLHFLFYGEAEGRFPNSHYSPRDATAVLNRASRNIPESGLFLAYAEARLQELEALASDHQGVRSTNWITPQVLEINSQSGALQVAYDSGCGFDIQINVDIPANPEAALVAPLVQSESLLTSIQLKLQDWTEDAGALHWAIQEKLERPKAVENGEGRLAREAHYDEQSKCVSIAVDRMRAPAGGRRFLRLWRESNEGKLHLLAAPFRPQYHIQRKILAAKPALGKSTPVPRSQLGNMRCAILTNDAGRRAANMENLIRKALHAQSADIFGLDAIDSLPKILSYDIVFVAIFSPRENAGEFHEIISTLNEHGVATVYVSNTTTEISRDSSEWKLMRHCHLQLHAPEPNRPHTNDREERYTDDSDGWKIVRNGARKDELSVIEKNEPPSLHDLKTQAFPLSRLPHVAIISVLYKKTGVIKSFLDAIYAQSYAGKISVVLVDDCSPDDSVSVAKSAILDGADRCPQNITLSVLENTENLGNCASRNRGIQSVDADIYSIIDCDCALNRDFVSAHVREHLTAPCEVVIGPLNLETHGDDAQQMMQELEADPDRALEAMNMQDDIQREGFVNCITRNLSVQRKWFERNGLFNLDFSYSAKPDSGFGWEDVELGYRIYASGAHVRFTPHAISLHQSHASSIPEERQICGSAKNFDKLFKLHPELELVARRWSVRTAARILEWAGRKNVDNKQLSSIADRFEGTSRQLAPFISTWGTQSRRLRIASYRWHVPHQYELHKLEHDFTLFTGAGTQFTNEWAFGQRPLRPNVQMQPVEEFRTQDFDLAILHFDENVLCPDLSNGTVPADWGDSFQWMITQSGLPCVAVCHGTPPFVGQYGANPDVIRQFQTYDEEVTRLQELLEDITVVCNSHQAAREWGFSKSHVIWHGFDPQEIPLGGRRREIVGHGVDVNRPHYRGSHAYAKILGALDPSWEVRDHINEGAGLLGPDDQRYAAASYRAWIDHVGDFKIYLNTTLRSPMPRARSEAMMAGVVPVSMRNHDVDHFVRNGVNGFYGDEPHELADALKFLLNNPSACDTMSAAARRTALEIFNHDRFLSDWSTLLKQLGI